MILKKGLKKTSFFFACVYNVYVIYYYRKETEAYKTEK